MATASVPLPETPLGAPDDPTVPIFLEMKKKHGLLFPGDLGRAVRAQSKARDLVAGVIPSHSVSVLVGDSGLGKSPLAFQLAMSVVFGTPFLGIPTRPGRVVYVDYENSLRDSYRLMEQQRRRLGVAAYPTEKFLFWPIHGEPPEKGIEPLIRQLEPDLLIIDSLRCYNASMESKNVSAVTQLRKLRQIATLRGTAVLLIHHISKYGPGHSQPLEDASALDWLLRSAGARALINQTDVRLAVSRPSAALLRKTPGVSLVMRGHVRTRGEVGPYLLGLTFDDDGEPLGYERIEATPALMDNPEQEEVFEQLPAEFTFKEARLRYGKQDEATSKFLHKLIRLGLLRKIARGRYRRTESSRERGVSPETTVVAIA